MLRSSEGGIGIRIGHCPNSRFRTLIRVIPTLIRVIPTLIRFTPTLIRFIPTLIRFTPTLIRFIRILCSILIRIRIDPCPLLVAIFVP